jgi:hypothetical protein
MGWEATNTHHFTIQSAYRLRYGDIQSREREWKSLWDWKGPHHIQTFVEASGEWAYLYNAQDVGEAMRQQPMCFEIISTLPRYGFV